MLPAGRRLTDDRRLEARTLYEGPAGGNAVVVQRLLAARGLTVSVRTIERAVSDLRRERRVAQLATVRVETAPGDQLQIDFGQKRVPIGGTEVRVFLLVAVLSYEALCRDTVITSMLGGATAAVPKRYAEASAIKLLPLGIPQVLVLGSHEDDVPLPLVDAYVEAATRAGDQVRRILIPGAGHFEIASPLSFTWPQVKAAIGSLLDGKLPL